MAVEDFEAVIRWAAFQGSYYGSTQRCFMSVIAPPGSGPEIVCFGTYGDEYPITDPENGSSDVALQIPAPIWRRALRQLADAGERAVLELDGHGSFEKTGDGFVSYTTTCDQIYSFALADVLALTI